MLIQPLLLANFNSFAALLNVWTTLSECFLFVKKETLHGISKENSYSAEKM